MDVCVCACVCMYSRLNILKYSPEQVTATSSLELWHIAEIEQRSINYDFI